MPLQDKARSKSGGRFTEILTSEWIVRSDPGQKTNETTYKVVTAEIFFRIDETYLIQMPPLKRITDALEPKRHPIYSKTLNGWEVHHGQSKAERLNMRSLCEFLLVDRTGAAEWIGRRVWTFDSRRHERWRWAGSRMTVIEIGIIEKECATTHLPKHLALKLEGFLELQAGSSGHFHFNGSPHCCCDLVLLQSSQLPSVISLLFAA